MTPEAQAAADLAAALKDAHARLRSLDAGAEVKAALARRLVAVSDAAKHDVDRAARRLAAVLADLDTPG